MPNLLESLAGGLRSAAGVLNPEIQRETFAADEREKQVQQQQKMLLITHIQQQVQSGAMTPEQGQAILQRIAPNAPPGLVGGPGVDVQAKLADMDKKRREEAAIQALGPNPTQQQLAEVGAKFADAKTLLTTQTASLDRKEAAAARVQAAKDAHDLKLIALNQTHELTLSRLSGEAERRAETARHNRQVEALQAQSAGMNNMFKSMMLDIQQQKLDRLDDDKTKKDVQQLSKAIEGAKLNDQNAVLIAAENAIKNPAVLSATTGLGSLRPDFTLPTDIALGKQAISKLFNIELKNRSGAAVTSTEFERLKDEYGKGTFKTPQQLAGAIKQARDLLTKHYQSVAAGFNPSTLSAYNENLAGLGGMPVIEPVGAPAAATPAPPPGFKVIK